MGKGNKQPEEKEKEEVKTIESRPNIKVTVFSDEWEKLGIEKTMILKVATGHIRDTLGLDSTRQKAGNPKNALLKEMKEKLTYEELNEVYEKLKKE